MLSAAASWDGLAAELDAAARSLTAVTTGLADGAWHGAAARAAAPYVTWLTTSATQAGQTANRRAPRRAPSNQSSRRSCTRWRSPPTGRDSYRWRQANLFGQNTPAIAAAEAAYEQMWAQHVAVTAGYHAEASAVVTEPTANALAGFAYIHPSYALSAAQFASGIVQPVSAGQPDHLHRDPDPRPASAQSATRHPGRGESAGRPGPARPAGARRAGLRPHRSPRRADAGRLFPHLDPAMLATQLQRGAVQVVSDPLGGPGWPVRLP